MLGGLGFIGSNVANYFAEKGCDVLVIDGLVEGSGGKKENVGSKLIQVLIKNIFDLDDLKEIIQSRDVIVDCMGWTSHLEAMENPMHDMRSNLESHIVLIKALEGFINKKVIYLGSRGQYGAGLGEYSTIVESCPLLPLDVQGINKAAAEFYFRIYAPIYNYSCLSLRLPNCFGRNQKYEGNDIGLVGGFIREAINGRQIDIYGNNRRRSVLYVGDLIEIMARLMELDFKGFQPININGTTMKIHELAAKIVALAGKGTMNHNPLPQKLETIDMGGLPLDETVITSLIGDIQYTPIDNALSDVIHWFKGKDTK